MSTTTDVAEIIATYGAAWNEPDADKRRALLAKAWADDGLYCDPVADVRRRDGVLEMISGFRER